MTQSTNEELETINDELRQRTVELNEVNAFLESILTSLNSAVVVVDRDVGVRVWNRHAHDLWGLRSDEVDGQHLMNLDIGLPLERVRQPLRSVLSSDDGAADLTLAAVNRRGRSIQCRVGLTPLRNGEGPSSVAGVILLMDADDGTVGPVAPDGHGREHADAVTGDGDGKVGPDGDGQGRSDAATGDGGDGEQPAEAN